MEMKRSLDRTRQACREGEEHGWQFGLQLYVSQGHEVVADEVSGDGGPGGALDSSTILPWLSAGKPITAVALGLLWEAGELSLDDRVVRFIPEFGAGGKQELTLRHLLTHTGGFRMLSVGWPSESWEEIVRRICAVRREPRWEPGRKAGYHGESSWFILGEIVQRLTNQPFHDFVRNQVLEPLKMSNSWIGMPRSTFNSYESRIGTVWDTSGESLQASNLTTWDRLCRTSPAAGACGPARELGRFYEMLLAGGEIDGIRLLRTQTVEALLARHRVGLLDHTFRTKMDWCLGFIPDSKHYGEPHLPYGYGSFSSSRAVGHSGRQTCTAFMDPEYGLVVSLVFNGTPGEQAHGERVRRILDSLYQDLGLGG